MKRVIICLVILLQSSFILAQKNFSFVFLPDIHLRPDSAVEASFDGLVKQINHLGPDFIITGGDMIQP